MHNKAAHPSNMAWQAAHDLQADCGQITAIYQNLDNPDTLATPIIFIPSSARSRTLNAWWSAGVFRPRCCLKLINPSRHQAIVQSQPEMAFISSQSLLEVALLSALLSLLPDSVTFFSQASSFALVSCNSLCKLLM